jgi:hypothetical protein
VVFSLKYWQRYDYPHKISLLKWLTGQPLRKVGKIAGVVFLLIL